MTARLLVAFAVLAAAANASDASQCAAVKTCYLGGDQSAPCVIAEGNCPPCMILDENSCYLRVSGSCPFGVDCFFSGSSGSGSSNSTITSSSSMKDSSMPGTADTTSPAGSSLSQANSAGGSSSETGVADSGDSGSNTVLVVAILGVAVVIAVLGVAVRKLFLRARAASEENDEEEILSPPATEMTASFSSNGTTREAGTVVARSAVGTDLSDSKTAVA